MEQLSLAIYHRQLCPNAFDPTTSGDEPIQTVERISKVDEGSISIARQALKENWDSTCSSLSSFRSYPLNRPSSRRGRQARHHRGRQELPSRVFLFLSCQLNYVGESVFEAEEGPLFGGLAYITVSYRWLKRAYSLLRERRSCSGQPGMIEYRWIPALAMRNRENRSGRIRCLSDVM